MNNMPSVFSRLCHLPSLRLAAVMLAALAWSSPAFCGEIHDSARDGNLKKVKALLKHNPALISSKDNNGGMPLHEAAFNGHKDVAELLLDKKAGVNARDNNGATPLHYAAFNGHKDVVELLLANKAEVNARDNNGKTPLQLAAQNGHKDVAELLRQHGGHE